MHINTHTYNFVTFREIISRRLIASHSLACGYLLSWLEVSCDLGCHREAEIRQ